MRKAYIAGPYTANTPEEVEENVRRAEAAAWWYYLKGYAVYCPHAQTHRIHLTYNGNGMMDYKDWLKADMAWLNVCDVIVFMPVGKTVKGPQWSILLQMPLGRVLNTFLNPSFKW
jgi:Domain of unknown function (DUF1937).